MFTTFSVNLDTALAAISAEAVETVVIVVLTNCVVICFKISGFNDSFITNPAPIDAVVNCVNDCTEDTDIALLNALVVWPDKKLDPAFIAWSDNVLYVSDPNAFFNESVDIKFSNIN